MPQQIQQQAMERAISEVENQLKSTLEIYGVPMPAAGQTNIVSVNDQVPQAVPGVRPANWQNRDGILYDPLKEAAAGGQQQPPAPLPNGPVAPVPTGAAVGLQNPQPAGPMTPETLGAQMKARIQKVI